MHPGARMFCPLSSSSILPSDSSSLLFLCFISLTICLVLFYRSLFFVSTFLSLSSFILGCIVLTINFFHGNIWLRDEFQRKSGPTQRSLILRRRTWLRNRRLIVVGLNALKGGSGLIMFAMRENLPRKSEEGVCFLPWFVEIKVVVLKLFKREIKSELMHSINSGLWSLFFF